MDGLFDAFGATEPVAELLLRGRQWSPLVLASPHSGDHYPADLLALTGLDLGSLRRSEDCYVDEIFGAGPEQGIPLLRARFARAYLDANREPFELDPGMFADPLPSYVNSRSQRVRIGLGTIARIVATGQTIYRGKLRFADALLRIENFYAPYHRALARLLDTTMARFGWYLLLDCHSMPSMTGGNGRQRTDFVLGDCHGTACHPDCIGVAQRFLMERGYVVLRNTPYAGGFTTSHYGRPRSGRNTLQIEINRSLYMNEITFARTPGFVRLKAEMRDLIAILAEMKPGMRGAA